MIESEDFPYLEIEKATFYTAKIEILFERVKHLHLAHEAKAIIYPLRSECAGLMVGGGANHIWFHLDMDGKMSDERVAIICFNPYWEVG